MNNFLKAIELLANAKTTDEREVANEQVEDMCYEFLIESGRPNYTNIDELKQYGYSVFPVERDSFGWLVGCLEVDEETLVYFG